MVGEGGTARESHKPPTHEVAMNPMTRRTPLQHKEFPKNRIASLALALALLGTLAGCGKSAQPTAPVPSSSSGTTTQAEAQQVAQQSAAMARAYVVQAKSLLVLAHVPGARPASERPFKALSATDSTSFTYALQGYDIGGYPIDWARQHSQLASLAIDFRFYTRLTGDSLLSEGDLRSHGSVAGLDSAATRFVANASDSVFSTYNGYNAGYHTIYGYAATSQVTNLTWEKSGTPPYPVAGVFAERWHWAYEYWYGAQHGADSFDAEVRITFNGTQFASMQVGTYTFTLDLETWTVS